MQIPMYGSPQMDGEDDLSEEERERIMRAEQQRQDRLRDLYLKE